MYADLYLQKEQGAHLDLGKYYLPESSPPLVVWKELWLILLKWKSVAFISFYSVTSPLVWFQTLLSLSKEKKKRLAISQQVTTCCKMNSSTKIGRYPILKFGHFQKRLAFKIERSTNVQYGPLVLLISQLLCTVNDPIPRTAWHQPSTSSHTSSAWPREQSFACQRPSTKRKKTQNLNRTDCKPKKHICISCMSLMTWRGD